MVSTVGLDIGGANLKAAHSSVAQAFSVPFQLWKNPQDLAEEVRALVRRLPSAERFALTMTGELCDCFTNQAEGVRFILGAVQEALGSSDVLVWSIRGDFLTMAQASGEPARAAAANWLALAQVAGRAAPAGAALVIDIGSTTTDIVPLQDGRPNPLAVQDPNRLACGELVYRGAERTPVCAVLGAAVAAEFFATMGDVYLVLGDLSPRPEDRNTSDGKPFTFPHACARLARMVCADPATFPLQKVLQLAEQARAAQVETLTAALRKVASRLSTPPRAVLYCGSGSFLIRYLRTSLASAADRGADLCDTSGRVVGRFTASDRGEWLSLADIWGADRSHCAGAYAVALLASEVE